MTLEEAAAQHAQGFDDNQILVMHDGVHLGK